MQLSLEQSYFGRLGNDDRRLSRKRLKKILRGLIFDVISFCRKESKKLKKRHQYQTILFPNDYQYEESDEVSETLKQDHQGLAAYPFYLTQCQLFIDNYHLKIIKNAPPLPIKFAKIGYGELREFAAWVGPPQRATLVCVTTLNIILVISINEKRFYKYCIEGKRKEEVLPLINSSLHGDYLFSFSQQQCHVCRYQNQRGDRKGLQKIVQKVMTDKKITRGMGMQREGKFYVFMLVQNTLVLQRLELGLLLSKIDFMNRVLLTCNKLLINLAIHPVRSGSTITHVVIAIATIDEVKLLSYTFETDTTTVFSSKDNPVAFNRNTLAQPPLLYFMERQTYLLCVVGFRNRLYFAKIEAEYCQFSKRIKFQHPVEYVHQFGNSYGLIVITNLLREGKNHRKIYLTHEDKLISYSQHIYTELVDKYEIVHESDAPRHIYPFSANKAICVFDRREVFMLGEGDIARLVLNTWQGIYRQMKLTQNIKLLKFLLLLNHVPSPFLSRPSSFLNLEEFFPSDTDEGKQILLEYYFHMEMEPSLIKLSPNSYPLLVPFMLAHQVDNLGETEMESLMQWCLGFDERLVEELIIGGSNCGWEIAVSRGWVRAFKVMVERGMELQMPILKLYSMAFYQLSRSINSQDASQQGYLNPLGQKYLFQMVEYILFILTHFYQELQGNGSNMQFKHTLFVILKEQLWDFMMRFASGRAIAIISAIFSSEVRIKEINKFSSIDFIPFHKRFKSMRAGASCSNSQAIVAHLSAIFEASVEPQDMEYLHMQHAKLMILRYEQFLRVRSGSFSESLKAYKIFLKEPYSSGIYQDQLNRLMELLKVKAYFRFHKDYTIQILKSLIKDQCKNLQEVYFSARSSSGSRGFEELQCEMTDFLSFLWMEIFLSIILDALEKHGCDEERYSLEECDRRVKSAIKASTRSILAEVEEGQDQFLTIHLLLASNLDGENTNKILLKFLACKNSILKQRVFLWLRSALGESAALQEELIIRLKEVIAVNNQQSRGLLESFFEGRQKEIIKKIDHDPHLQLEYLQLIIKNATEHLEPYYTNLHLQLILKLKPDRLIDVLATNSQLVEYEIAEALRMTLSAADFDRKNDTLIYLYEREGELMQCITTYLTSFEILVYSYIAVCERSMGQFQEGMPSFIWTSFGGNESINERSKLVTEIDRKFDDSLKLLFRIPQRSYQHSAHYLRKLNSIWKAVVSRDYIFKAHYVQFITGYFGQLIIQLFERNCLLELSGWLEEERANLLEFVLQLQGYLVEGYEQMLLQLVILRSMAKMEKKMLLREITDTLKQLQFCISSAAFCFVCDRPFGDQLSSQGLLFNCGHLYHRGCIEQVNDQDFCFHCVSRNQYKSMIENDSLFLVELLKKFREKRRQKRGQQEIRVEGRRRDALISVGKKRTNRLALYDKKATAIENQAQIIDIRLMIDDYYSSQIKR